jgi:hypothetical protein
VVCLYATAILASAVAHGRSPYGFEDPVIQWLGPPSAIRGWAHLAELLAAPTIIAVFVVSLGVGLVRRALVRVVFYSVLAALALLISEHGIKPLVQRTYYGELTFPSGNVTAVSATALAMWLALRPLLDRQSRHVTLVLGVEWVLLMSQSRRHRVRVAVRWRRHCRCCRLRTRWDSRTLRGCGARSSRRAGRQVAVRCRSEFIPNEVPCYPSRVALIRTVSKCITNEPP